MCYCGCLFILQLRYTTVSNQCKSHVQLTLNTTHFCKCSCLLLIFSLSSMSQNQFAAIVKVIQTVFMHTDLGSCAKSRLIFALPVFKNHSSANCYFMDVAKAVFICARFIACVILTNFHNLDCKFHNYSFKLEHFLPELSLTVVYKNGIFFRGGGG